MLTRSFRWAMGPTCFFVTLVLLAGCASKRSSTRAPRYSSGVLRNIAPEREYNPPAEPDSIPRTPPAPRDADPAPPARRTSDTPAAPPKDDFESAERPGRFSASFGPFTGRILPVAKFSNQPNSSY